jgi:hypothetical protein
MSSSEDKSPDILTLSPEERRELEAEQERQLAALANDISRRYDPARLGKLSIAGAGRAEKLDEATRRSMEGRLGARFTDVRVVRGAFADRVTRKHGADAVTVGATGVILMRDTARTNPHTSRGRAVLAHELTHVKQAQQGMHFAHSQHAGVSSYEQDANTVEAAVKNEGKQLSAQKPTDDADSKEERLEAAIVRTIELFEEQELESRVRIGDLDS